MAKANTMPAPRSPAGTVAKEKTGRGADWAPELFQRRILIVVTGLTPQVATETAYALAISRRPAWVPTELRIVTTGTGGAKARAILLGDGPGAIRTLCDEWSLPPISFGSRDIHVVRDGTGHPLDDLRTEADHRFAADLIARQVLECASDPASAIHVSLAGGRKTMSFLAGYCLSLFGRAQDRLTHVLVPEEFDGHPEFFFPTRRSRKVTALDGRALDLKDATVSLAEVPFVALGTLAPALVGSAQRGLFSDAVEAIQKRVAPPLRFLENRPAIDVAGLEVDLQPLIYAWYAWFVWLRREGIGAQGFVRHTDAACETFGPFYGWLAKRLDWMGSERTAKLLSQDFEPGFFEQKKARLNRALQAALGGAATGLLIVPRGKRPLTRFGISLDPARTSAEWKWPTANQLGVRSRG